MTDLELDHLARALIAATDRLNSAEFRERQARYLTLEQEYLTLGAELEAEEKAVEAAQLALTAYVGNNYIDPFGGPGPQPGDWDPALEPAGPELFDSESDLIEETRGIFNDNRAYDTPISPLPTEEDEYATAKANGALS